MGMLDNEKQEISVDIKTWYLSPNSRNLDLKRYILELTEVFNKNEHNGMYSRMWLEADENRLILKGRRLETQEEVNKRIKDWKDRRWLDVWNYLHSKKYHESEAGQKEIEDLEKSVRPFKI
jgi:hypothetical protein